MQIFALTRPKPAYGRQGLDWIVGPGYCETETNQRPWETMKLTWKTMKITQNHETNLKNYGN